MRAAAHDPALAKRLNIPQTVAKEFLAADRKKAGKAKGKGKR